MGRVGTGLTAATLPLIIAVAFAQADCVIPAVLFSVMAALLIIGTFAPYVRGLHRLPGIGAPRLTGGITANGSPDLTVQIPRPREGEPKSEPHSLLIRVGVTGHSRADVEHALLNFAFPVGHGLKVCDHHGRSVDQGKLMPPTQEVPSLDYWAMDDLRLTGRNSHLFHFRVRVSSPGDYRMVLRIQSKDLFEELVVDKTLHVAKVDADSLPIRDKVGTLIDEGESIRDSTPEALTGNELQHATSVYLFSVLEALRESGHAELAERLKGVELDYTGPEVGDDYCRALVAAKVRALYEIRDQLPVLGA